MKKTIITSIFALFSLCAFSQARFYTVDAQLVESGKTVYSHIISDTLVVDSTEYLINCWFGQVGNPYVRGRAWTQFVQIKAVIKGDINQSQVRNSAKRFADAYRKRVYPNVP